VRYEGELPAKREPLKPYAPREAAPVAEAAAPAAAPAEAPAEAPAAEAADDDEKPESEAE